jgi:hypothetical protein
MGRIEKVRIESLRPTQRALNPESLYGIFGFYVAGKADEIVPPVARDLGICYAVLDGHNVTVTANMVGEDEIDVYVPDDDQDIVKPFTFDKAPSHVIESRNNNIRARFRWAVKYLYRIPGLPESFAELRSNYEWFCPDDLELAKKRLKQIATNNRFHARYPW